MAAMHGTKREREPGGSWNKFVLREFHTKEGKYYAGYSRFRAQFSEEEVFSP
jgi:hypothetical protein